MKKLETGEFKTFVEGSSQCAVVFSSNHCAACEIAKNQVANTSVPGAWLMVEDHLEVAREFGVLSVPTTILFRHGKEVDRQVGSSTGLIRRCDELDS